MSKGIAIFIILTIVLALCNYLKKKEKRTFKTICTFFYSSDFLDIIIEILIVFLGAIIALQWTDNLEKENAKKQVISYVQAIETELDNQNMINRSFYTNYSNGDEFFSSIETVKANLRNSDLLTEHFFSNSDFVEELSPDIYLICANAYELKNSFWDAVLDKRYSGEELESMILSYMDWSENLYLAFTLAEMTLDGTMSESEANDQYWAVVMTNKTPINAE